MNSGKTVLPKVLLCSCHIKFPVNTSCHLVETIYVTLIGVITSKAFLYYNVLNLKL